MSRHWLSGLLERLQVQLSLDTAQLEALRAGSQTPWWLSVLLGLAAWISATVFIVSFLGPWLSLIEGAAGRGLAGFLLILAALWMFRFARPFSNQIGLALSLAGQGLLVFVLVESLDLGQDSPRAVALPAMVIAGVLLWLPSSFLHRHLCALLLLVGMAVLVGAGIGLALFGLLLGALACALWLCRQHWATHAQAARIRALADAATLVALFLAALPHGYLLGQLVDVQLHEASYWTGLLYPVGLGFLLVSVVAWLSRHMKGLRYWSLLGLAALGGVLATPAPGLLLCLALGLALFHACNRNWLILLPAFAIFYLFVLYYSLHVSLLEKSLLMMACGAVLLVGARLVSLWPGRRI